VSTGTFGGALPNLLKRIKHLIYKIVTGQPSAKRKRANVDDSPTSSPAVKRLRVDETTAVNTGVSI
jgi:hypothetical protein